MPINNFQFALFLNFLNDQVFQGKDSLHDVVRITLGNVMASLNALVTAMQEGEYDTTTKMSKVNIKHITTMK